MQDYYYCESRRQKRDIAEYCGGNFNEKALKDMTIYKFKNNYVKENEDYIQDSKKLLTLVNYLYKVKGIFLFDYKYNIEYDNFFCCFILEENKIIKNVIYLTEIFDKNNNNIQDYNLLVNQHIIYNDIKTTNIKKTILDLLEKDDIKNILMSAGDDFQQVIFFKYSTNIFISK